MDLKKLNSITKYPSIPTYHKMGLKGKLTEETEELEGRLFASEKIDGTNARIIVLDDRPHYYIGSREELLYAQHDELYNPNNGIVDAVRSIAEYIVEKIGGIVIFGEAYGHKIGSNAKQYSVDGRVGFRVFDIAKISEDKLDCDPAIIAAWRDGGGQEFFNKDDLKDRCDRLRLDMVPDLELKSDPPKGLKETLEFMEDMISDSKAILDLGAGGQPEGIVIRNFNRSKIFKLRFEDYERSLR